MSNYCKCHYDTNLEIHLESYPDYQSVHEAVSTKLTGSESSSLRMTHIGASPVRKAYSVNKKITFEDEKEYKTSGSDIHDLIESYSSIRCQSERLREQIKKGDSDKNTGGKSRKYR